MKWIFAVIAAAVTMGVLDGLWLGVVAKSFYRDELGGLMRERTNVVAAVLFYVLYIAGVVVLVVRPYDGVGTAALVGAALGLLAYGTYDLTNMATIDGFTWRVTVVDLMWGAVLTAAVSAAAEWATTW